MSNYVSTLHRDASQKHVLTRAGIVREKPFKRSGKKRARIVNPDKLIQVPVVNDITIENHGSVVLFRWHTDAGRDWLRDSTEDGAQYFGPALAVEPRYADALAEGASAAGLILG